MPSRTPVRILVALATAAVGVTVAAPAARADANLPTLTLPSTILAGDGAAHPFSFTTANSPTLPTSASASIVFSGVTGLSSTTLTVTCDSNASSSSTHSSDGSQTVVCPLSTSTDSHSGTIQIGRGDQGARVAAGQLQVAVTTTVSMGVSPLIQTTTGNNSGVITVQTPPSASETPGDIPADNVGHDVAVSLSTHDPATAGQLFRLDLSLSGTGAAQASIVLVGAGGSTTAVPLSGSPLTGELSPHSGVALVADGTATITYRITVPDTVHSNSSSTPLTIGVKLQHVDSSGTVLSAFDTDSDDVHVINKPGVSSTDFPATFVEGATPAASFTQKVRNRSGANVAKAELHYAVTAPAGVTADKIHLAIKDVGASTYTPVALSGTAPTFAGTFDSAAGFALPDDGSNTTTVDFPSTLSIDSGGHSGPLTWAITVFDQSNHTTQLSDVYAPVTVAETPPQQAPTNLTAVGSNRTLKVSFDPGDNGSAAPISYIVTATPPGTGTATTVEGSTIPVTVGGLVNDIDYTVSVRTKNRLGQSGQSASITGKPVPGVPGAPAISRVDPSDGYAVVTVTPPSDNGGAVITSYRATYYRTDGQGRSASIIEDATDNTITLPGLTNDAQYAVIVLAVNRVGAGPASSPAVFTPSLPGGPTSPAGIEVSLGATAATVASGSSVVLSGFVSRKQDPQQGMSVLLTFHGADKKTVTLGTVKTDSFGAYQFKTKPAIRGYWLAQVTSVAPAVSSPKATISTTAVLKSVKIVLTGRTLTATGFVTPGFKQPKVAAAKVSLQLVKVVKVHGVKITRVVKTIASGKARQSTKSGNPFTLHGTVRPGSYLVRVGTTTTYLLASGASKSSSIRVR